METVRVKEEVGADTRIILKEEAERTIVYYEILIIIIVISLKQSLLNAYA